ncbi:MAG TPA: ABC transporter permease [Candidatus Dormibacteraeota bacterium]|nr:ABC transporter permease [Candidatus Dormibacteraeota bacterium]
MAEELFGRGRDAAPDLLPRPPAVVGAWRALTARRRHALGLAMVAGLVLMALVGPLLAPYDPIAQQLSDQLQPPSLHHWLGTDQFGRDILSRILAGARLAMLVGLLADAVALCFGSLLGLVAAFSRSWVDAVVMRVVDMLLAFPYLLLAMVVIAILGTGLTPAVIAIGVVYVPQFARLVRSAALAVREEQYVEAARALGVGRTGIVLRHALPNVAPPAIAQATLLFGISILEVAGLGFLGLGAQPPTPEWGTMLADSRTYVLTAWWLGAFPGLAIMISVLAFNLLGDAVRDAFDAGAPSRLERDRGA